MTADAPAVAEDPRARILARGINRLWDLEDGDVTTEEAAEFLELLDRHDEDQGVVRVNLLKQRAIEADRDRLRGVVHAMLQAFEGGRPAVDVGGTMHLQSIWIPEPMYEGWRAAAEGVR